uniref:Uncharacterized protein n=1 Tax=Schistocephalus solidus TaxID=70667 RepID=A0A0X3NRU3_SCHSO
MLTVRHLVRSSFQLVKSRFIACAASSSTPYFSHSSAPIEAALPLPVLSNKPSTSSLSTTYSKEKLCFPIQTLSIRLTSGLLFSPLLFPQPLPEPEYKCVNDIQNRRRKMKKHKRRKWRKKYASLIRKYNMLKEKKAERKLNELLELWRSRSEAWEPSTKIQRRLVFARRSGYFIDILNTRGGLNCQ